MSDPAENSTDRDSSSELSALGRNVMDSNYEPATGSGAGRWLPPAPEELAEMLAGYEVTKMLGRGGMGAVYMGRQTSLDRVVAIKILSSELEDADAGFAERFKNEARAMAKLNHPGIVAVFDFGETENGMLFIVMEYVDGTDVARMIAADGRLHTEYAMAITAHVCDALSYAHERGILHRDIKPANIMVGYDGVVKVADFGLAKAYGGEAESVGLTQSGMVMGTMHYMAPELMILGSAEADQRVDVYAVGVMLYHMLTGKVPHGMFELPSIQVQGLDPRYDGIIAKAMREDREQRYQKTLELRSDLDGILTQPVVHVEATADAEAQAPAALPTNARPKRPGEGQETLVADSEMSFRSDREKSSRGKSIWVALVVLLLFSGGGYWWAINKKAGATQKLAKKVETEASEMMLSNDAPEVNETSEEGAHRNTLTRALDAQSKRYQIDYTRSGALKVVGTAFDWNDEGEPLGAIPIAQPTPGQAKDVSFVASGYEAGGNWVAVKQDGTVFAAKDRMGEQIPKGLAKPRWIDVGRQIIAVKQDGTLAIWGKDIWKPESELKNVVKAESSHFNSIALHSDGHVSVWGPMYDNFAPDPDWLRDAIDVASGSSRAWVLKADGSIIGWDDSGRIPQNRMGYFGELRNLVTITGSNNEPIGMDRDGRFVTIRGPVSTALSPFGKVVSGRDFDIAISKDGRIFVEADAEQRGAPTNLMSVVRGAHNVISASGGNNDNVDEGHSGFVAWVEESTDETSPQLPRDEARPVSMLTDTAGLTLPKEISAFTDAEIQYREVVYKSTPQGDLKLRLFFPPGSTGGNEVIPKTCVIWFHEWMVGRSADPSLQRAAQAAYFAERGAVTVCPQHRVKSTHGTTPDVASTDAKSVIRWVREHANALGIDPARIVACGGTEGGHISAVSAMVPGFDDPNDALGISCRPDAVVMLTPKLNLSESEPEGFRDAAGKDIRAALSPVKFLSGGGAPPSIQIYGEDDRLLKGGLIFAEQAAKIGAVAEVWIAEGQQRNFFTRQPWLNATNHRIDEFLVQEGLLSGSLLKKEVSGANMKQVFPGPELHNQESGQTFIGEWWQRLEVAKEKAYRVELFQDGAATLDSDGRITHGRWSIESDELELVWNNGVRLGFPVTAIGSGIDQMSGKADLGNEQATQVQLSRRNDQGWSDTASQTLENTPADGDPAKGATTNSQNSQIDFSSHIAAIEEVEKSYLEAIVSKVRELSPTDQSTLIASLKGHYGEVKSRSWSPPIVDILRAKSPLGVLEPEDLPKFLAENTVFAAVTPANQLIPGNLQATYRLLPQKTGGWFQLELTSKRRIDHYDTFRILREGEIQMKGTLQSTFNMSSDGFFSRADTSTGGANYLILFQEKAIRDLTLGERELRPTLSRIMEEMASSLGVQFEDPTAAYSALVTRYLAMERTPEISDEFDQLEGWAVISDQCVKQEPARTLETSVLGTDGSVKRILVRSVDNRPEHFYGSSDFFDSWYLDNSRHPIFSVKGKVVFGYVSSSDGNRIAFSVNGTPHSMIRYVTLEGGLRLPKDDEDSEPKD